MTAIEVITQAFYVIRVYGDVEPSLLGPFKTPSEQIKVAKAHIPSLTDENEDEIDQLRYGMSGNGQMADYAELAVRTCSCGRRIDGFYEYVDHLITMLGGESHIGG